ncbi:hypothetical protein FVE85_9771 [Porphyridium purpureum]|uniref:PDZ domain-containing protein n=1 Tax=Porphyridium purpureum TaxID=35688 RepID=A0A5J4YKC9_PORPP|nr:hypothetical protein FVE85_9765 [Porphyridium purpureum]KAA8491721.1 hypothetical protein FVE85_9768 [Porphyridium purpureum]KAA8491724.1 hypothetical protein FVE85_9771 [Porphyridium purpureum]|eukprot:POR8428..scf246_12
MLRRTLNGTGRTPSETRVSKRWLPLSELAAQVVPHKLANAMEPACMTPQARRSPATLYMAAEDAKEIFNIHQDGMEESENRPVQKGERKVTVEKPIGLLLEERDDGMVFVREVAAGSNGEKAGVKEGDVVVAVSAVFKEDELWSTTGVGLEKVMKTIEARLGECTLVLQ